MVRTDDNVILNYPLLTSQLLGEASEYENDMLTVKCPMPLKNYRPIQSKPSSGTLLSKWSMQVDEYQQRLLPTHCTGWVYVTTPELSLRLAEMATNLRPEEMRASKVCDYFITGIVRERIAGSGVDMLTSGLSKNPWKNLLSTCPVLTTIYRHLIDGVVEKLF